MNTNEIIDLVHKTLHEQGCERVLPELTIKKSNFLLFAQNLSKFEVYTKVYPKIFCSFSAYGVVDIAKPGAVRMRFPIQFDLLKDEELKKQVVLHETAHVIDFANRGYSMCGDAHGSAFKKIMKKLNCDLFGIDPKDTEDINFPFKLRTITNKWKGKTESYSIGLVKG